MAIPFGLAIFTGAFLLFVVQPLMARFILPWFGGGPAVWTTCMLFFQVLLLGGYAYAHWSCRRLAVRRQVMVHLGLVAVALLLMPITPGGHWKPPDGAWPAWRILVVLAGCLGLPYLVLSATGPLMQAWFSRAAPGESPYRLYALSNTGSLLALLGYPFLIEPNLSRQAQALWWSAGLGVFAALAAWCGAIVWRRAGMGRPGSEGASTEAGTGAAGGAAGPVWLWFALPACASVLLLAVTNRICLDIAVIPFLWLLPLSLYLLSFIVSFDSPRWYWRPVWLPALALALGAVLWMTIGSDVPVPDGAAWRPVRWLLGQAEDLSMFKLIAIYLGTLFVCCMVCHGEAYRLRPDASHLTGFYLAIAAGGAFGGFLVAVIAPLVCREYFELQAGLMATAVLAAVVLFADAKSPLRGGKPAWAWAVLLAAIGGLGAGFYRDAADRVQGAVEVSRGFYGVLKVKEFGKDDPANHGFRLQHGSTVHGMQFDAPDKRRVATSYYTPSSGIAKAIAQLPRKANRRIGVVGLGAGTLAAFGKAGDCLRFYEIDASVLRLARKRFSYLNDSAAAVEVVLGDGRLSMEREPPQRFDLLVLDAFSSDAVPVHLLTREAFEIYSRHMQPDGVIVVNITNRVLDLEPVVMRLAEHFGFRSAVLRDEEDWDDDEGVEDSLGFYQSDWMLLTRNEAFLKNTVIAGATGKPGACSSKIRMWTDEESSLLRILFLDEDGWLGWLRRIAP